MGIFHQEAIQISTFKNNFLRYFLLEFSDLCYDVKWPIYSCSEWLICLFDYFTCKDWELHCFQLYVIKIIFKTLQLVLSAIQPSLDLQIFGLNHGQILAVTCIYGHSPC